MRPSLPPSFSDPALESFGLDCSVGRLDLYFDSLISAKSLHIPPFLPDQFGYIGIYLFRFLHPIPTHPIQLIDNNATVNTNNTLFGMTRPFTTLANLISQGNTTHLILYLSSDDFARLTLSLRLSEAPSASKVYLSMDGGVLRSASELHGNKEIPFHEPVALSLEKPTLSEVGVGFVRDTAPPYLTKFSLNLNIQTLYGTNITTPIYGLITLTFSEPVDAATGQIFLRGLSLQSSKTFTASTSSCALSDDFLPLTYHSKHDNASVGGIYFHYYSFVVGTSNLQRTISYALGSINTNKIKTVVGLCTASANCFLSGSTNGFAHDLAGNNVSLIGFDRYNPIKVSVLEVDEISPSLLYWTYDSSTSAIRITFSESVYMIFFNYSKIILLNSPSANLSDPSLSYLRISAPADVSDPTLNTDVVSFTLSSEQQQSLKSISNFLRSESTSYMFLEDNIVVDTSAQQNVSFS